jgi:transposase-like protein
MNESLYPKSGSRQNVSRHVCEECGESFYSLNEYVAHYRNFHPRSIGTAIT